MFMKKCYWLWRWISNVKRLLYSYGFADCFINSDNVDGKLFPRIFKQRLIDYYVQNWHGNIENSIILDLYKICKLSYRMKFTLTFYHVV
jgi:hypothetical protein